MASLGDLTLFVSAETDRAQKDIKGLGKEADKIVGKKREIGFDFGKAQNDIRNFKRDIKAAGEAAKVAFKVAKMEGFLDDEIESAETLARTTKRVGVGLNEARKPGQLLKRTFDGLGTSVVGVVNNVAKLGFALYGLQQIAGLLQQAFGGFFNATIGQNIQLREQILKSQTALASTMDVFVDGNKIAEPLAAIEALTSTIEDRIDSIRERSLELAGITSAGVIEVFGITAQQIGQVGGSLKDAEDLAISFSAALGTFGIPIFQARQEIGALLRGDIDQNAYLAKALGITGEDIRKAKNSTEGLVSFLQKKLEASVAGQAIAAKSFSGVISNIADFQELLGQRFGEPLLDPLLAGLNKVFALLTSIKSEAFNAAEALGRGLGSAATIITGRTGRVAAKEGVSSATFVAAGQTAERVISGVGARIAGLASDLQTTIANILLQIGDILTKLGRGIAALGAAFVGINVGVFKSLASTFEILLKAVNSLAPVVEDLLRVYAGFLDIPLVGYFAELSAQFKLLDAIGVTAIAKLLLVGGALKASWASITKFITGGVALIQAAIVKLSATLATLFAAAGQAVGVFAARLGTAVPAAEALAASLQKVSVSAAAASVSMKKAGIASNFLVGGFKKAAAAAIIFNIKLALIVGAIALVVKAIGDFRREQQKQAANKRAGEAYKRLSGELANLTKEADKAKLAQRDLEMSILSGASAAAKADWVKASQKVDKLRASLEEAEKSTGFLYQGSLVGTLFAPDPVELKKQIEIAVDAKKKAEKKYLDFISKLEEINTRANIGKEVDLRSKELGKLNERLAKAQLALQRQVAQDRFNAEMELAQKQVELARSVEQERILLIENRNRKLVEGEEGASAEALAGLIEYARERNEAEADADAQRKQRVLAIEKLENEIENYKFQIGQKVLELRKQGAKIDKEAADYVKKVHEQIMLQRGETAKKEAEAANRQLPAAVSGVARVGNTDGGTGRSSGPHIDIRGGNRATVKQDALALIKAWQSMGVEYIQLSNIKRDVKNITDPAILSDLVEQEINRHGLRVPKGTFAADIAVPEGTVIPGATAPSAEQHGAAGHMAKLPSGNDILHLMNPGAAAGMSKPDDAALQAALDTSQNFTPPDISGIENAKREVNEILNSIQDSQTRLKAIAADRQLQEALKRLAPKAQIEQFKDATIQARALGKALAENQNVERAEIIADLAARKTIAERELEQFLVKNAEIFKEDAEKRDQVAQRAKEIVKERLDLFEEEKAARLEALEIERTINQVRSLAADAKAGTLRTNQGIITGTAQMNAGMEFDKFRSAEILAQGRIDARRAELEADSPGGVMSDETLKKFKEFEQTELFNAERQAQMDAFLERFQMLGDVASGVGQAIGGAMTQGVADILSGTATVNEVLSNMFKNIADSFMQMATKIIADMIKMIVLKQLVGIFGGPTGGGGAGMFGGMFGGGGAAPTPGLNLEGIAQYMANGGIVTGPTAAVIGEGGMNEAVVPLPNGKAIPVDFGKKGAQTGNVNTNITVNVDQGGNAQTEMTGEDAGKLGKAIDVAVKRVIMEERRSGGLLHNGRR